MADNSEKKNAKAGRLPNYGKRSFSWVAYAISNGLQTGLMAQMTFYLTDRVYMTIAIVTAIIAASRISSIWVFSLF